MTKEGIIPVGILRTRRSFHRGSKRLSFEHHNIELLKKFEKTTSTHAESADFVLLTNRQEYPYHKIVSLILFYTPLEKRANHALTLKNYTTKCYLGGKSNFLQYFQTFSAESRKNEVKLKYILIEMMSVL